MPTLSEQLQSMRAGIDRIKDVVPGMPVLPVLLTRMLMTSGLLVTGELERALRPFGLSESDFRTLIMIFASPDGRAFPSELCQFASQKPTNMTRIVDGLVRQGLVTRTPSAEDRRRIILHITRSGRELAARILPQLFPHVRELFAGFSERECRQFETLLQKLINNLSATLPDQDLRA